MLRQNRKLFRNRLDLTNRVQVRVVKRRLRVSEEDLKSAIDKVGNSIAASAKNMICKERRRLIRRFKLVRYDIQ